LPRAVMVARLELRSAASCLSPLDVLTDFESWGRLREGHDLSIEAARKVWMGAIGRMLPIVPSARSNARASS